MLASCLVLKRLLRWRSLKNRSSFDPHKLRYPQFVSYSIYFMAEADGVQFPNALHQQTDQVDDQYPLQVLPEQGGVVALGHSLNQLRTKIRRPSYRVTTILGINRRTINFCAFLRPLPSPPPPPPMQCCRFVYIYGLTYCTDKIIRVLEM